MNASEAMYFDGAPYAHIVAYEDRQRVKRQAKLAAAFMRDRRTGSRALTV